MSSNPANGAVSAAQRSELAGAASARGAGIPPSTNPTNGAVSAAQRSELAGAASARGAGIPPRSERDPASKER